MKEVVDEAEAEAEAEAEEEELRCCLLRATRTAKDFPRTEFRFQFQSNGTFSKHELLISYDYFSLF